MAEIILTAVINKATELAGNLLLQEWSHLSSLEENTNWLLREMRYIQSYIDDPKSKVNEGDSKVKNLIKDIEELAGDAEDLLDEFMPKMELHKNNGAIGCFKESIGCVFCSFAAHKFAMEIDKIKTRVVDIARVKTTYGVTDTTLNNNQQAFVPMDRRRLFLHIDETEVIGLDDDFNVLQGEVQKLQSLLKCTMMSN